MGDLVAIGPTGHTSMPPGWSISSDNRTYCREVMVGRRVAELQVRRVQGAGWVPVLPSGVEGPVHDWADDACAWAERAYCGCMARPARGISRG